jgi:glycerate kinase
MSRTLPRTIPRVNRVSGAGALLPCVRSEAMDSNRPAVVLAPDSFKGSLDATDVCAAMAEGLRRVWPAVDLRIRPMADGGEGTLDAVLAAIGDQGSRSQLRVRGAGEETLVAAWGLVSQQQQSVAVIESAQVVGITDAAGMRVPVTQRSTRGVGELIRAVLDSGVRRFMIGLGGSSTNDGGAGLLEALGLRLLDAQGAPVAPTPAGLATLSSVDAASMDPRLREIDVTIMSDVSNPLCGPRGATAIFGPQKGVTDEQVADIDRVLERFATLAERALGTSVSDRPGAGAAGGLGFALQLVGGRFASGARVVADLVGLDDALREADWAITGEGRSDAQTLLGKAPFVVAQAASRAGVPASLLSGALDAKALPELGARFAGCFALPDAPMTLADCIANAAPALANRAEQMARLFEASRR